MVAAFDCRVSQLPSLELVVDYFRWRAADATRNSLLSHCYWAMRKSGSTPKQATKRMVGLSIKEKQNLLLNDYGINFNELPSWQKQGVGLYWEEFQKSAMNPITGEAKTANRRRIKVDLGLPVKDDYSNLIERLA